jgi:hypothetical protein
MHRTARARYAWELLETVHAVTYFAKACRQSFKDLGVPDAWDRYFGGRAAPLGRVVPSAVTAIFYGFAEQLVAAHLPSAFAAASPEQFLHARLVGATTALTDLARHEGFGPVARALAPVAEVASELPASGAPLFAVNRATGLAENPVTRTFQLATLVREWRGDHHNAILAAHGIDGCAAHVLMWAIGAEPIEVAREGRGWTEAQWDAARAELAARALVSADGSATPEGRTFRAELERATDARMAPMMAGLDDTALERLIEALTPIVDRLTASGELPTMRRAAHLLELED